MRATLGNKSYSYRCDMLAMLLPLLAAQATEPPAELLAAQNARAFVNGQIEFTGRSYRPEYAARAPIQGVCRFHGDDRVFEQSFSNPEEAEKPYSERARSRISLIAGQKVTSDGRYQLAQVRDGDSERGLGYLDARAFGLTPDASDANNRTYEQVLWNTPAGDEDGATYAVTSESGLKVVSRTAGNRVVEWWIDPQRGWNIIRCEALIDGRVTQECRTSLKKYGETWFPESIVYYDSAYEGGAVPESVIEITVAKFNDESMPPLTLVDAGIDIGTNVYRYDADGKAIVDPATGSAHLLTYNGSELEDWKAVMRRVNAGELNLGPHYLAHSPTHQQAGGGESSSAAAAASQPGATSQPSAKSAKRKADVSFWKQYTQEFITRHALSDEQQQKAWRLCERCEGEAMRYQRRVGDKLHDVQQQRASIAAEDVVAPQREAQLAELDEREQELLAPIARLFEDRLVPGLEKLLTREQRERAGASPAP